MALIILLMPFFIPSLGAKTLLLVSILAQMSYASGIEKGKSSLVKGLVFGVTIMGTMFCIGILTSHAANPITAGLLEKATGVTIAWADWFKISSLEHLHRLRCRSLHGGVMVSTGAGSKTIALTPVVIAYAMATGLHVTPFVMLVGMNMLHQYLLPVINLPNIIGLESEEITSKELIKTGAVMSIFGASFMTLMVYTYWTWIGMFN